MDNLNLTPTTPPINPTTPTQPKKGFWAEVIPFVIIALIIVVPIRLFVFQPFLVEGASMVPNFANNDYLIIDELTYHFRTPERNEVVIFKYPKDKSKYFIKRIVALPGETVEISRGKVTVHTRGGDSLYLEEDYTVRDNTNYFRSELGDKEYFVLGDNRGASSDSRSWGPVMEDLIIGRPYIRLLPVTEISILPGDFSIN